MNHPWCFEVVGLVDQTELCVPDVSKIDLFGALLDRKTIESPVKCAIPHPRCNGPQVDV